MSNDPALVGNLLQQAVAHHRGGRLGEAEKLYKRVLQAAPDQTDALRLLAGLALQTGRHSVAETLARKALGTRPDHAELHRLLATALLERGRGEAAAQSARRALELEPGSTAARLLLGNALHAVGDLDGAEREWRAVLRTNPDDVPTQYNLAQLLLKKGHNPEARELLEKAVAKSPTHAGALALLAEFKVYEQPHQAVTLLQRAIGLGNKSATIYLALARALQEQKDYRGARSALDEAARLDPKRADVLVEQAELAKQAEQFDRAMSYVRRALALEPKNVDAILKASDILDLAWGNDEELQLLQANAALDRRIGAGYCYRSNLSAGITPAQRFAAHRQWAARFLGSPDAAGAAFDNPRQPDRRLRVGYVSGDFQRHAVAFFALPLLAAHDPTQIDLFAYSDVVTPDAMTDKFRGLPLAWRDIAKLDDDAVAQMVRRDKIDILVDLAGLTTPNRLRVFARRAAPVQMTYLGYPNTTGSAAMDYRIVDGITDPPGVSDQLHSERLLRIKDGFLAYQAPPAHVQPGPLPALAAGRVTFGSGNNFAKVDGATLAAWAKVLSAVPNSRLMLKDRRFAFQQVRSRVQDALAKLAVDPGRVVLEQFTPGPDGQFQFYQSIDIALDTFPYNGTTTTFEALSMGTPVVTLTGDSHAGRVGASILHHLGMGQLVAGDIDRYVGIAAELAGDLPGLAQLRSALRARLVASPLCDANRLAREIEAAYRMAWQQWCANSTA